MDEEPSDMKHVPTNRHTHGGHIHVGHKRHTHRHVGHSHVGHISHLCPHATDPLTHEHINIADDIDLGALVESLDEDMPGMFPTDTEVLVQSLQSHGHTHSRTQHPQHPINMKRVAQLCHVGEASRESLSLPLESPIDKGLPGCLPNPFPDLTKAALHLLSNGTKSSPSSPMLRRQTDTHVALDFTNCVPVTKMVSFQTDSGSTVLGVKEGVNAHDLCHLLVLKTRGTEDKHWVIVEHIEQHNIERPLEDHECVLDVFNSWDKSPSNTFIFRKDPNKYELFQNPAAFFPDKMLVCGNEGSSSVSSQRAKKLLLQSLFSTMESLPDIQGHLQLRETKRSWKNTFFQLKSSGLYYSTKGHSKDDKNLLLFADVNDCDVYKCCDPKKLWGAPTNNCFAIKPSQGEIKVLCADDEKTQECWIAGCRLRKHGAVLRDNYHTAMRRHHKLCQASKAAVIQSASPSVDKSRVAMDFTGANGRVVIDPNEALGVAVQEGQHWRKRHQQYVGSKTACSPPKHGLSAGIHMTQPWFYSGISRKEAILILTNKGLTDGLFLVRESGRVPGMYVISLVHNGTVKHLQINKVEQDGQIYYSVDRGFTKFSDLIQLVDFYQINSLGMPTQLKQYAS